MADTRSTRSHQTSSTTNRAYIPLLLLFFLFPLKVEPLSLFIRTTWLSEVPEPVWRSWFELIKQGRREGPTSAYYIEELALQNTACCESHAVPANGSDFKALGCLGPKCSDLGLAPNTLLTKELDLMSEYFALFDTVYVGTTVSQDFKSEDTNTTAPLVAIQRKVGAAFMARYGDLPDVNYGWYITQEGSLTTVGMKPAYTTGMHYFIAETMKALSSVRSGLKFLWSPSNGGFTPTPAQRAVEEAGLTTLLCDLPHPLALHFQDWLGQSVTFEFPYYYNYSNAFTCEKDTVPTMEMLRRVSASCPTSLREVKVNAEMFVERHTATGMAGEDNGAYIVNADPRELASRLACYKQHNLEVGASWAINHWHSLLSYANTTVYTHY